MKSTKKYIMMVWIWYLLSAIIVSPFLVRYFFVQDSIWADVFAELVSLGIPTLILAVTAYGNSGSKKMCFTIEDFPILSCDKMKLSIYCGVMISVFVATRYLNNALELIYIINTGDYSIVNHVERPSIASLFIAFLVFAILPAIYEELLFRGMFLQAFLNNGMLVKVLIPSLVFASAHSGLLSIVNAFAFGMVLMICYLRTKSLKLVIIFHCVNNILSIMLENVIMLPFSALAILNNYADVRQMYAAVMISLGVFLLSMLICVGGLVLTDKQKGDASLSQLSIHCKCAKTDRVYCIAFVALSIIICIVKISNFGILDVFINTPNGGKIRIPD